MSHPTTMLVGGTYRTEIQVYDRDNPGEAKAPDSTPTASVTKNGSATGDSVTIAAAAGAATGHYKLSYTPSGAAAGDTYAIRIVSVIATVSYPEIITFVAIPATVDANVVSMATDSISAAAVSAAAVTEIQTNLPWSTAWDAEFAEVLGAYGSLTYSSFLLRSLPTAEYATESGQTSILNKMGAFTGTGVNTILGFLKAIMRADASVPSDVGGTYAASSDSLEASANAIAGISANGITVSASSSVLDTIDDGGNITIRRGDRVSFSLTLGNVSGRTGEKLFLTMKRQNTNDTDDSNAILQVTETTGAVLVNGSATGVTAADASITVSNETTGATVFVIQDSITTLFPVGSGWHYDVQMIRSDGKAVTLTYGTVAIVADTTRRKTI